MHQTAAQKVLQLPELVTEIVRYIVDCGCYPCDYCKRFLAPIALANRAFATPVFDRLWADLGGLSHLLNLFPSSLYADNTGSYDLRAPISDSEWDSFTYYARFVRHLRIARSERISRAAFDALLARAEGSPLLPKLQRLQVDAQEQFADYTYQLIPPTPEFGLFLHKQFDVGCDWLGKDSDEAFLCFTENILDKVYARAPSMKRLKLSMNDAEEVPVSRIRTLARFRSLQALTVCAPVTASALLDSCAQLPLLSTLEVNIPVVGPWYENMNASGENRIVPAESLYPNAFIQLQQLRIKAAPSYVADILAGIRGAPLRALKVSTGHSLQAWQQLMRTLRDHFTALQDVFLSIQSPVNDEDTRSTFWEYFGALTDIRTLKHVRLAAFERELAVTDRDVHAMADAWPLIETLMLEVAWRRTTPAPSLESLRRWVERCPALRTMELPCPEPTLPPPSEAGCLPHRRVPSASGVRELWLTGERWTGENGERCVEFVRELFPRIAESGPRFAVTHSVANVCKGGTLTHINYHRPLALVARFPVC